MNEANTLTIKQMAERTGLSTHTLRYYERMDLLDVVARDPSSNHRRYSSRNIERINFVKRLRETGMPLRQIQDYVSLIRQGEGTIPQRLALLAEHRRKVEAHLRAIEGKIEWYQHRRKS
jgi:DNA-binding transcriptional MerR regulator